MKQNPLVNYKAKIYPVKYEAKLTRSFKQKFKLSNMKQNSPCQTNHKQEFELMQIS